MQMKKLLTGVLFGLAILSFNMGAYAADKGTADEAVAMVKKAVAYLKANGKEKAIAEFNNPKGQFNDRDLFIVSFDMAGNNLSHSNTRMHGKNFMAVKDADNKQFIKDWYDVANTKGKGWVDYKWVNPTSQAIEQKTTYIEKADDMLIGCGVYK
jgi:cytochrome c